MAKDTVTLWSECLTIIAALLGILAFFGLYKIVDIAKLYKCCRNKKLIRNRHGKVISLKKDELKTDFDRDYYILKNKAHWIRNHRTLNYIMKFHPEVSDRNSNKVYLTANDLKKLEIGFTIDIDWESI